MTSDFRGSVLVVEDNDRERESLLALLRRAGHQVSGVGDVASALLAFDSADDPVDVVLCDLRLNSSTQTGVDLLREWKRRRPSTPFIFVTGVFEIAHVVEAVKLGAEDYITKPYNAHELLRRVEECVEASEDGSLSIAEARAGVGSPDVGFDLPSDLSLEQLERIAIEAALRRLDGNRTHAADNLGISVRTLQRKLKAWSNAGGSCVAQVAERIS